MSEYANEISELIIKFYRNELSEVERNELDQWRSLSPDNEALFQELTNKDTILAAMELQEDGKKKIWAKITGWIPSLIHQSPIFSWRYLRAAVVVFAVIGGGLYFLSKKNSGTVANIPTVSHSTRIDSGDVAPPSGFRAILSSSNGNRVVVDSTQNGLLIQRPGLNVAKLSDGRLVYKSLNEEPVEITYDTLTTGRGGKTNLVLADGSKVWLNASSSIRFPSSFSKTERRVEITGEAYFEITPDQNAPFIVKVKGVDVVVLGTRFNLMAYNNEEEINATLLEGAIRVSSVAGSKQLRPGQQAAVSSTGSLKIQNDVDLDQVVDWKNGEFNFDGASLRSMMKQVERWYDVEVVFDGHPDVRLGGSTKRNQSLSNVIRVLRNNGLNCQLKGRVLKISK